MSVRGADAHRRIIPPRRAGVDNRENILYRSREEVIPATAVGKSVTQSIRRLLRLNLSRFGGRCAALILAVVLAASAADAASAARARSDAIVSEAEALIMAAGKSSPTDTAKVNQAIDKLHEALKVDPRNDSAYVDLGFCYGLLRDGTTAVDMYRTATLINPAPANYKELADVYLRMGQPEAALMAANAGLVRDPHNAPLFNAKGLALNDLARFDEAAHAFRQALVYDPSFEIAKRNLDALGPGYQGTGSKRAKAH